VNRLDHAVLLAVVAVVAVVRPAQAQVAAPSAAPAVAPSAEAPHGNCQENFPPGSTRPKVTETFPDRGKTGYALVLDVVVEHGKGETVLPSGVGAGAGGNDLHLLQERGFYLPNPDGPAAPKIETKVEGERARSHLTIPVVALPKKPGRAELVLPQLPIAMSRASGEVRTLCTQEHTVILEDPIANTPAPKPKGNVKPLRQREEWTAAKHATIGAAIALVVAALIALFVRWLNRRPKPVPPPPPPRPPWEVALEELFDVRIAQLVEQGRLAEHFDRVSDAVRRYLGARYGYDGLETTTHEALAALRRVSPQIYVFRDIEAFLQNADLVKFAKLTPTETECESALGQAEDIVRRTMPVQEPVPMTAAAAAATSGTPKAGSPPIGGSP
jgi:hypothetical protein